MFALGGEVVLQRFRGELTLLDSRSSGAGAGSYDESGGGSSFGRTSPMQRDNDRRPATAGGDRMNDIIDDDIPFVVKGPTTEISKFAFESWGGAGGWFVGHKLAFQLFEKHPGLPFINEQGIPEAPVAIHWSNVRSQRILGLPGAYEAGYERTSWLVHMLMNWIGDDGFLTSLTQRYPTFNLLGDTTWCRGTVRAKELLEQPIDGKRHAVRCEVRTENQRGDVTTTGEAVVVLRSREAESRGA